MNTRALLLSALIAGIPMALFSELPIVSILNCCLCLWIWAGGIFAVYLYRRFDNTVGPTTINQGLLVGLDRCPSLLGVTGLVPPLADGL